MGLKHLLSQCHNVHCCNCYSSPALFPVFLPDQQEMVLSAWSWSASLCGWTLTQAVDQGVRQVPTGSLALLVPEIPARRNPVDQVIHPGHGFCRRLPDCEATVQ